MGRNDEAVAQAKRGLEADPFLPLANFKDVLALAIIALLVAEWLFRRRLNLI